MHLVDLLLSLLTLVCVLFHPAIPCSCLVILVALLWQIIPGII